MESSPESSKRTKIRKGISKLLATADCAACYSRPMNGVDGSVGYISRSTELNVMFVFAQLNKALLLKSKCLCLKKKGYEFHISHATFCVRGNVSYESLFLLTVDEFRFEIHLFSRWDLVIVRTILLNFSDAASNILLHYEHL